MRVVGIFLLLSMISATALGEVPESIVGTWRLDMTRTMNEYFDQIVQAQPESKSAQLPQEARTVLAEQAEEMNPEVTFSITKDTMTVTQGNEEPINTPYTVIGGNSRLVIIESTDDNGYETVLNIRLVEGGIATETTNCREKPEQCKRERQRAAGQKEERSDASSSTYTVNDYESDIDGDITSTHVDQVSQPKWVYFKQVE